MNTNRPSSPLRSGFNTVVAEYAGWKIALCIAVPAWFAWMLLVAPHAPAGDQGWFLMIGTVGAFALHIFLWSRIAGFFHRNMDNRSADIEEQNRVTEWDQHEDWRRSRGL